MALPLLPGSDVRGGDGRWIADTAEPWLRAPGLERLAGRWVSLRYAQGLLDEAIRPLARFRLGDGTERRVPLNGAPLGEACWIGRVPDGTVAIDLCPVRRPGPFVFTLSAARVLPRTALLLRGLRRNPAMTLTAVGARVIGARDEARHCLAFAATAGAPGRASRRGRRDADRTDPDEDAAAAAPAGPTFHLLVRPGGAEAVARTRVSLAAQRWTRWRLWLPGETHDRPFPGTPGPDDWVAVLDAGDRLPPLALAQVAAAAARDPGLVAVVGDEAVAGVLRPRPDWSPLDGAVPADAFVRMSALDAPPDGVAPWRWRGDAPSPNAVAALYRPLRQRDRAGSRPPPLAPVPPADPFVTVVVPFRDKPALLSACLAGLRRTAGRLEIVLVDNGSTDPTALAATAAAVRSGDARIVRRPGPFNYAALCNAGAAAGTAPLILFLNNDVEPTDAGWLRRLAAQAGRPSVGAVGARLLFPDGRLQHGGVVVGMGGTALHPGRGGPDRPDPLGLLDRPRRVGAVTGAVMMVARDRFDAVGGFDADAFPILLNDIDLCLRLAARGWACFYEPRAVLIHHESASRGRLVRPLVAHAAERARFAARWADAIRHDPGFHPALSLWSMTPAPA